MNRTTAEGVREFIRTWTGGVDEQCRFRVVLGGAKSPEKIDGNTIEVGALWLRKNGIPSEALADTDQHMGER